MLNLSPDKLRDEVKAAEAYRDLFTAKLHELTARATTSYFKEGDKPRTPTAVNHAYEYLSLMIPQVAYGVPRCTVQYGSPGTDMHEIAEGLKHALNALADDEDLGETFETLANDFFWFMGVALTTSRDQPGRNGWEELVPQTPYVMRISPYHFAVDPLAKDMSPLSHNGPRYMMHMWKADAEDLLKDPTFDDGAVQAAGIDQNLEKYDGDTGKNVDTPKRNEIVAWDIWIPELQMTDEEGYNGSVVTVGCGSSSEGRTKKTYFLRKEQPCFCPPWGPYSIFGAYKVMDCPYPLSPIVATAETAEEVNAHVAKAAQDAGSYKKYAVGNTDNPSDAQKVKHVKHGEMVLLDNPKDINEVETGGVSPTQYDYNHNAMDRLDRLSGVSDAMRGNVSQDATATAEAIAQSGTTARLAQLQKRYRRGVQQVFRSMSWELWYDDMEMHYGLGIDGGRAGTLDWEGGMVEGQEHMNPLAPRIKIEPYSLEHTSSALLQKRMTDVMTMIAEVAPLFAQAPYIPWKDLLDRVFEAMNVGELEIDEQMLQQFTGVALAQVGSQQNQMQLPGQQQPQVAPALPMMGQAQMQGAMAGSAVGVA